MTESDLPTYHGEAMAIHVPEDGFSVEPTGPDRPITTYQGTSPAVVTNENSPPQWDDSAVEGPHFDWPIYTGRSPAIHVYGEDVAEWPPIEPIPSCECLEEDCTDEICGITDTFTRTVAAGWGTSDAGLPWLTNYDNEWFSVNGSAGIMTIDPFTWRGVELDYSSPEVAQEFLLRGLSIDWTGEVGIYGWLTFSLMFGPTPMIASLPYTITFWAIDDSDLQWYYRDDSGDYSVPVPVPVSFRNPFDLRVECSPTVFRARMWTTGSTEPETWDFTSPTPDADWIGNSVTLYPDNDDNVTMSVVLDSLDISGVDRCTEYRFDNFNRTVSGGWGVSDSGAVWTSNPNGSVDGTSAHLPRALGNGSSIATPADVIDAIMRFTIPTWPTGTARWVVTADPGGADISSQTNILLFFSEGSGLSIYRLGNEVNVSFAWSQGATYLMRVRVDLTATQVKVWLDGTTEPSSWTAENMTTMGTGSSTPNFGVGTGGYTGTGEDGLIDYIDFDYEGKPCYEDCQESPLLTGGEWHWAIGFGDGAETSDRWGIGNGRFWLDVAADSGANDSVGIVLNYSDYPELFDYIQDGTFTFSGTFVLPYDIPPVSQGEMAEWHFVVMHDDGSSAAVLEASLGGHPALAGRVILWGPGITNQDTVYPGALTAGTHQFSMTVSATGASAVIAGHSLSITNAYDLSRFNKISTGMGQAPIANTNLIHGGLFEASALDVRRTDGTTAPWCVDVMPAGCPECEDPENPGQQLPPFTPGYMPTFRRQIGDPTTSLDSYICVLESAAMVLDWHTRGAVKVWGGELIPWCGRTEAEIIAAPGTTLYNAQRAWLHWSQHLSIRSGGTWADLMVCLAEGRAVVLLGDYGEFTLPERCQDSFEASHGISVYPYQVSDRLLVGDPLCSNFKNFRIESLQDYAEAFGIQIYGVTSPQKILFAVSRTWSP